MDRTRLSATAISGRGTASGAMVRSSACSSFDHARPAPPFFDVAYAVEYVAPFRRLRRSACGGCAIPKCPTGGGGSRCSAMLMASPFLMTSWIGSPSSNVSYCSAARRSAAGASSPRQPGYGTVHPDAVRGRISWTESLRLRSVRLTALADDVQPSAGRGRMRCRPSRPEP